MTIKQVKATAVAVPVRVPTSIATRTITARAYLLVEVVAEDGVSGVGYAYVGTNGGAAAVAAVSEILAPVVVGAGTESPVQLWPLQYQESLLSGRRGLVIRALSAIDLALWDLRARRSGLPLADLLGGDSRRALPAYASGGYYRPAEGDPVDYVRREISRNREAGFVDHKIKVGGLSIREDAERVRAAHDVIGDSGRLALDANNAYASLHEGLRAAQAFEDVAGALWWFEEPFSPDDIESHRELGGRIATPVATGEIHQTRWDFNELVADPRIAILQPDVGVLGGVTEWLRIAHLAGSRGRPIAPHWHANAHAQLASAVDNCLTVEHFTLDKDIYNFEDLLVPDSRLRFDGGNVILSSEPGLGLTFDESKIQSYRIA